MNDTATDKVQAAQRPRSWLRRHLVLFVLADFLATVLIIAAVAYWALYFRIYRLEAYQAAMAKFQSNDALQQALGQPIAAIGWRPPAARLEAEENEIRWDIGGPNGHAKAHLLSKLRGNEWQTVVTEATLANGKKIVLAAEGDAQKFVAPPAGASNQETSKPEAEAPPPEINLPVPPGDGPAK